MYTAKQMYDAFGIDDPSMLFESVEGDTFTTEKGFKIISWGEVNLEDSDNFRSIKFDAIHPDNIIESGYGIEVVWGKVWSEGSENKGYTDED